MPTLILDLGGRFSSEIWLTPEQEEAARATLEEYRGRINSTGQGEVFILGQIVLIDNRPKMRLFVTSRKLGRLLNKTIHQFFNPKEKANYD
jgi:hypothetical protein